MTIEVTAEYYNRLKMAGLITNDRLFDDTGPALFTGFAGIDPVAIRHRNTKQMPEGVLMQMVMA